MFLPRSDLGTVGSNSCDLGSYFLHRFVEIPPAPSSNVVSGHSPYSRLRSYLPPCKAPTELLRQAPFVGSLFPIRVCLFDPTQAQCSP